MFRPNASFSTARRMNRSPDSADVSIRGRGEVSVGGKGGSFSKGRPCALEGNMGGRSGSPVFLNKGMLLVSACMFAVSCANFRAIGPDDAGPDSDTEMDSETGSGKGSSANGTGQDSSRDTGTGLDAGTGSGMRPDSGAGPDSDSHTDSDMDSDSEMGSGTDTSLDSDTEQDSDTDSGDSDSASATDEGDTGGDTGTQSPSCKLYSQVASINEPGFAQEEISADEKTAPGYSHPEGEPFAVRYEFPQGLERQDVEGKRLGLAFDGAEDWSFVSLDAETGKISFGKGAAKDPAQEPGTLNLSVPVSFGLEDGSVASITISSIENAQKVLVSIGHSSGDSLPALNAIAGNPIQVSLGGKEYVFVLHGADPVASTAEVSLFERFERVSSGETLSDGSLVLLSFGENGLQVILATSPSCE